MKKMTFKYDLVIKNGNVMTFNPDMIINECNIGISGDKIICITKNKIEGRKEIDVREKLVLPGFIDFHSHVDGKIFSARCIARQGGTTTIGGERSFDGLALRDIQENGFLINHGFFVSHSFTLRKAVGNNDPYCNASDREIDNMISLAERFLKNGSFGIHFGLELVPGTSEKELMELAMVAQKNNSVIVVHMREDGLGAIQTLDEIFKVAKSTGVSVHISHLMYMVGFNGIMETALDKIEKAISDGCDITADTGIYSAFPACIGSAILDGEWYRKYGSEIKMSNLVISSGIYAGDLCNYEQFDYLRNEFPNTLVSAFVLDENQIPIVLKKPYVFVSTNAADGPHYEKIGHPETAGTFPRLIKKYVIEEDVIDIFEAVKKISLYPAIRFGIRNKGQLKEGYDADIAIIDYDKIEDKADFINKGDPNEAPEGIEYVIVNGKIILHNNQFTNNEKSGRMINALR